MSGNTRTRRAVHNWEILQKTLPLQIRICREDRGWTQAELARRVGTSQSHIAAIEKGTLPSTQTLIKLASAFDVALEMRFGSFSELSAGLSHIPSFRDDPDIQQEERNSSIGFKKEE